MEQLVESPCGKPAGCRHYGRLQMSFHAPDGGKQTVLHHMGLCGAKREVEEADVVCKIVQCVGVISVAECRCSLCSCAVCWSQFCGAMRMQFVRLRGVSELALWQSADADAVIGIMTLNVRQGRE